MKIRFRPLFTVAIQHSYYAGACSDLKFVIPLSTAGVLRGGKLMARMIDGRLHVLFETDSDGIPISSLAGHTLTFGMRLVNPCFSNFTAPVISNPKLLPFYTNSTDLGVLDAPVGVALASGVFRYTPQTATRPLTMRLSDSVGTVVATETLDAGIPDISFDLRALPGGDYRIEEDSGAGSVTPSRHIVSAELRSAGVWGILAVKIDAGFYVGPVAPATPVEFFLDFSARKEQLKYFVVANRFSETEFDQLSVSDNGFQEEQRDKVTFDKVPSAAFSEENGDIFPPSLLGDGASRVVMFRSQLPVARRERGLRKIQLNRNGDILVEHLPQPGADRSKSHHIVHLSKP